MKPHDMPDKSSRKKVMIPNRSLFTTKFNFGVPLKYYCPSVLELGSGFL